MPTKKISIKTGTPVEGNDFYGRKKELQYAWETHILKGNSLKLSAPRKAGKSSFSKKMLELAEENGWKTLYLDLQGIGTENEFVKLFKEELKSEWWWNKVGKTISKIFNSIIIKDIEVKGTKIGGISIKNDVWRNDTYGKIKKLIESTGEILIVIDELTFYLHHLIAQENGKEKVEFFLEWLRKFRQTSGTKARWILCSSVEIEILASRHQLSKYLDIHPFLIGAFSEDEAKDFISRLDVDENVQFTNDHIQYILNKLVWYLPFFIQILVEKINFLIRVESKRLSNDIIDEAYNCLITENHFNHWDVRLYEYYEFEDNARKILKLCTLSDGRSREDLLANLSVKKSDIEKTETILARLLYFLKNDGYLTEHNGKYIFCSPLLRDFWRNCK